MKIHFYNGDVLEYDNKFVGRYDCTDFVVYTLDGGGGIEQHRRIPTSFIEYIEFQGERGRRDN